MLFEKKFFVQAERVSTQKGNNKENPGNEATSSRSFNPLHPFVIAPFYTFIFLFERRHVRE